MTLRPYQEEGVRRVLARKDRRLILAWDPGAGKTLGAITIAKALNAKRILVVASALARPVWMAEFAKWSSYIPHSIRFGKKRKCLTIAHASEKEDSYAADVQVVSYALVKDVGMHRRDLVILDEMHALRNPLSKQSRAVKALLRANPDMPCIGLSASPIPSVIQNIWNPVDTLYPNALGSATRTGDVGYSFKSMYMLREEVSWPGGSATHFYGVRNGALKSLSDRIAPFIHRVCEPEFAKYLPPLNASITWVDECEKSNAELAEEWLHVRLAEERTHVGLFSYTRDLAKDMQARAMQVCPENVHYVSGEISPEARAEILAEAAAAPRAIVIATCESVRESISLSFIKNAAIFEWRQTPAQAVQLIGRFARADSTTQAPTFVEYFAHPGDEEKADTLRTRIDTLSKLYAQDPKSQRLAQIMQAPTMTEAKLTDLCSKMFATVNHNAFESWSENESE